MFNIQSFMLNKVNLVAVRKFFLVFFICNIFTTAEATALASSGPADDGMADSMLIDHDNDGIPTVYEDYNNNDSWEDDDTDGDGIPNYLDADDDNDGIDTKEELFQELVMRAGGNTDDDAIPNYLDDDDDNDGILTVNEQSDFNHNNVPDYLEVNEAPDLKNKIKNSYDDLKPIIDALPEMAALEIK